MPPLRGLRVQIVSRHAVGRVDAAGVKHVRYLLEHTEDARHAKTETTVDVARSAEEGLLPASWLERTLTLRNECCNLQHAIENF